MCETKTTPTASLLITVAKTNIPEAFICENNGHRNAA